MSFEYIFTSAHEIYQAWIYQVIYSICGVSGFGGVVFSSQPHHQHQAKVKQK